MLFLPLVAVSLVLIICLSLIVPGVILYRTKTVQIERTGLLFRVFLPAFFSLIAVFVVAAAVSMVGFFIEAILT